MSVIDYFSAAVALDQNQRLIRDAEADVYALSDTTFSTPLAITDLQGVPMAKLRSSAEGIYPDFRVVSGAQQILAKSGDRVTPMTSLGVIAKAAEDAAAAASSAASSATGAAETAVTARAEAVAAKEAAEAVGTTNDGIMTAIGADPGSAFRTLLDEVAVGMAASLGGDTVNCGDSITQQNTDQVANRWGDGHGTYFGIAMKGRAPMLYNDGIGGTTSAQMLSRFATNVLSRKPSKVRILAGTNDSDPITQTLPNVEAMIRLARLAGAEPILHTIPPFGMPPVPAPASALTATPATTGGTLAAGTYQYKVTSRTPQSIASKTVGGESLPSAAVSATTTGSTGSVVIEWDRVPDATTYGVYRSVDGGATFGLIGTASAAVPAFRDTGTAAGVAPPIAATAGAPAPDAAAILKGARVNNVIHHLARKHGVDLVDFYHLLTDPATGMFRAGYASDGVHPTPFAQRKMGELAAQKSRGYPAGVPYLVANQNDPTVLYNNGLFQTGSPGRPTGWGPYGGGVGTESCLPEEGILGNAYQVANLTSGLSPWYNRPGSITTGFAPGDKIGVSVMLRVSGLDRGGLLGFGMNDNGSGGGALPSFAVTSNPNDGEWFPWYGEGIVRNGATQLWPLWTVRGRGVSAAIAQLTIRNLTALGVAS